jgi:hypothetical protein
MGSSGGGSWGLITRVIAPIDAAVKRTATMTTAAALERTARRIVRAVS